MNRRQAIKAGIITAIAPLIPLEAAAKPLNVALNPNHPKRVCYINKAEEYQTIGFTTPRADTATVKFYISSEDGTLTEVKNWQNTGALNYQPTQFYF